MQNKKNLIVSVVLASILFAAFYYFKNTRLIVDEEDNYPQIINFINFKFQLLEISALPGYHTLIAICGKALNMTSIPGLRGISLVFSFFSVIAFFAVANKISPLTSIEKTLQYFFLPILFVFFFLLYTDVVSILFIILAFLFLMKGEYRWAGVFAIISMMIRQNNVIWLAFMVTYVFAEKYKFSFSQIKSFLKTIWVFIFGFILFAAFVVINGGVAVGDKTSHPAGKLSTGNIFFILFYFFILFLPLHIANFKKVLNLIQEKKIILFLLIAILGIYLLTFKADHPYNHISPHYYLRNRILIFFTTDLVHKLILFIPISYAVLSLIVTPMIKKSFNWFYPFTCLFLLPSWLIEQRYFLIPFVFFILFKQDTNKRVEWVTIIYFVIITGALFRLIRNGIIFL